MINVLQNKQTRLNYHSTTFLHHLNCDPLITKMNPPGLSLMLQYYQREDRDIK